MDIEPPNSFGTSFQVLYKITVNGILNERWADWFNGTIISHERNHDGKAYTALTCQVRDQAELFGILNQLNSLNLSLLQVTLIGNEGE